MLLPKEYALFLNSSVRVFGSVTEVANKVSFNSTPSKHSIQPFKAIIVLSIACELSSAHDARRYISLKLLCLTYLRMS